jgi:hypothetical protein
MVREVADITQFLATGFDHEDGMTDRVSGGGERRDTGKDQFVVFIEMNCVLHWQQVLACLVQEVRPSG